MKTSVKILLIVCLFSIFAACNKDNKGYVEPPKNYLSAMYKDSSKIAEFFFDKKNRVSEVQEFNPDGGLSHGYLNSFDAQNRNTLIRYYDSTKVGLIGIDEIEYDPAGNLYRITFQDEAGQKTKRISFIYNNKRKVIIEYHYAKIDSSFELERNFTYTYNTRGNVIIKKEYEKQSGDIEPVLIKTFEYEYDDANNPFRNLSFVYGYKTYSENNVVKATVKSVLGQILDDTYSSEYVYNEHNYPELEMKMYLRSFDPINFQFEYLVEESNGKLPEKQTENAENTNNSN